jgi:hypothetical protein
VHILLYAQFERKSTTKDKLFVYILMFYRILVGVCIYLFPRMQDSSDKVVTQLGRATIVFNDGLVIKVANNSNLLIKEQVEKKTVKRRLRLILGKLSFKTGKSKDKRETIFETPTAVCAIRGTAGTLSVEWKGGKLQGKGTSTFADGSKYVGEFKNGKLLHEQGTLTLADGSKYVGEWKNGKRNGQGTLTYPNGEKRVGEFKDGKYVGKLRVSRE